MDYGILSLLPSLLAILLAVITRQVFISLFAGIYIGKLVIHNWSFLPALNSSLDLIISIFANGWMTKTIIFSFLVGSILTLIQSSGGVAGLVYYLTEKKKTIKSRTGVMLLAYIIGVSLFIESTICCLVSGTVARPVADKFLVSREKLSFICDSSSAPICSLLPFNGWGATLIGLITVQVSAGVITGNPVEILLKSNLFNFYSLIALVVVLIIILSKKDFGPMKKAEQRAMNEGKVMRDGAIPVIQGASEIEVLEGITPNKWNMILPLIVLVGMMPIGLYITGNGNILEGSGSTAVFWAVLTSLVFAGILYLSKRLMNLTTFMNNVYKGAGSMIPIATILVFAFSIGQITNELGTGEYMASIFTGKINSAFVPAIIFLISAITAFSTGTSWGTFAIMMPIAIQMAAGLEANLFPSIGAVISGGVMGDHCSPISDTTIVASMATSCDHIDHVRTQIPYAVMNGTIAMTLFILAGFL
jgi:Na+/H+ antiporter NhaC